MVQITRELAKPPRPAGELDSPHLFKPSQEEWDFLHAAISGDDEKVRERVIQVQRETYEHYPYPCIKSFHFTNLMMKMNPVYPKVLEAGRKGDSLFLDVGCFVGTDLRKLVQDGYPATNVAGCDLRYTFIDVGYKLYDDKDACGITFLTGDILDLSLSPSAPPSDFSLAKVSDLAQLKGALTHVYAGALFHLYDEDTQFAMAMRFILLLKDGPGCVVFGRHQGKEEAGYLDDGMGRKRYGHNAATWTQMWKKAFTQVKGEAYPTSNIVVEAEFKAGEFTNGTKYNWFVWSVSVV